MIPLPSRLSLGIQAGAARVWGEPAPQDLWRGSGWGVSNPNGQAGSAAADQLLAPLRIRRLGLGQRRQPLRSRRGARLHARNLAGGCGQRAAVGQGGWSRCRSEVAPAMRTRFSSAHSALWPLWLRMADKIVGSKAGDRAGPGAARCAPYSSTPAPIRWVACFHSSGERSPVPVPDPAQVGDLGQVTSAGSWPGNDVRSGTRSDALTSMPPPPGGRPDPMIPAGRQAKPSSASAGMVSRSVCRGRNPPRLIGTVLRF